MKKKTKMWTTGILIYELITFAESPKRICIMYVHTQDTQDNSKAKVILYETFWLLFNGNKKYFTKILTTFRPVESVLGGRGLGSWQFHDRNEEKGKKKVYYLNDRHKVWQMCYGILNNITIILSFLQFFFFSF